MPCAVKGCKDVEANQLIISVDDKDIIVNVCANCTDVFENADQIKWELA